MKIVILCEFHVELFQPVAFEVDGIDEHEAGHAVYIIRCDNLLNFVVGLFRDPPVNDLSCSVAVTPDVNTVTLIIR